MNEDTVHQPQTPIPAEKRLREIKTYVVRKRVTLEYTYTIATTTSRRARVLGIEAFRQTPIAYLEDNAPARQVGPRYIDERVVSATRHPTVSDTGSSDFDQDDNGDLFTCECEHAAHWKPEAHPFGCDSADGTYIGFGPSVNGPRLIGWLEAINAAVAA